MERSPAEIFADHCRRHELAYQQDDDGRPMFRPRVGATTWRVSAGVGTVYAATVMRPRGGEPRPLALIDLDEGFRMMSRVVGVAPEAVAIGMRVRVVWSDDEVPVPSFVPELAA